MNDAERLSHDPSFRLISSEKIWERGAALTSRLQSFETELLTQEENLVGLAAINRDLIARAEAMDSPERVLLDMDSTEIPVYGQQEQSAYNGHFESTCYHPLLLFSREGDCLAAKLRPGNVHSAEGWEELLLPEIERQQRMGKDVAFRADAAFAKPEIYEALEERGVEYTSRIPANENLERDVAGLLPRPVGRPSIKPLVEYKGFLYQAASWKTARRVVAKVEHHAGELFPRVGFIVTNLTLPSRAVVRFYNKRGTSEQWIKEGKQAVKMTRLSCHRFRSNEVRLWLSVIAYNLGNLWRRLVLPNRIETWSLTSLQQRLVKTGGRLVKHARHNCCWPRGSTAKTRPGGAVAFRGAQAYVMGRSKIENGNSLLKPEPGLLAEGNGSCLWYSGKGFRHIPNRCFVKVILPCSGPRNVTSSEQGTRAKSRARSYAGSYCTIVSGWA